MKPPLTRPGLGLVAIVLALAPGALQPKAGPPPRASAQGAAPALLKASGRHFLDPSGRAVILRGVSLSGDSKVPPFRPGATAADFDRLADLGVNVVRLLLIWEAYEPAPGSYDEGYLAELCRTAALAWSRGIYTVVDVHQDGFSRFASRGAGDGFPSWALSPRARPARPDNGPGSGNWALLMATDPNTYRSFDDFFSDANGVRTRFLGMLARVSAAFAGTPGVIGYDLLNEPWGDEPSDLTPLYRDATAAVRSRHPGAIVFLEGQVTTNCGLQSALPRPDYGNAAYAPHYYKPTAVVLKRWHGGTLAMNRAFGVMAAKAASWDAPLFLGEFGLAAEARRSGDYVAAIYDRLDALLASGAQWNYTPGWTPDLKDGWNGEDFNIVDPGGRLRPNFRPRPYPRATAGLPLAFRFESGPSPSLAFVWDHDPDLGTTEIFVPRHLFPPGATALSASPGVVPAWDAARQVLLVSSPAAGRVSLRMGPAAEGRGRLKNPSPTQGTAPRPRRG